MLELNKIYNMDCLEGMKLILDKSIDMILCDLPYGTTACEWDTIIPLEPLWEQYNRIIKDNGAIVLFGSEPFSSYLRMSNIVDYKYDLYWVKEKPTNFFQLKKRFGKTTETISVFYKNNCMYNPQMVKHIGKKVKNSPKGNHNSKITGKNKKVFPYNDTGFRYPCDILNFNREKLGSYLHPTQKPVLLLEYLIKTYSNENELILDNCMGSGSTAIACINTNRKFIGFELDKEYYDLACKRIEQRNAQMDIFHISDD